MAKLIYTAITSLDGYVADREGKFDWAVPDDDVHRFVNERERSIGTYLFGRRLYEVMSAWDDMPGLDEQPGAIQEYAAIWRDTDKVVYSTTLSSTTTRRTRLERDLDRNAIRQMKHDAERDLSIGGPGLAGQALGAGLVDECGVFLNPVVVGGGTAWLPRDVRIDLELLDEH